MRDDAKKRHDELDANRFYRGTVIPGTSMRYMGIKAGNNGKDLEEARWISNFNQYGQKKK